jgi:hypothetical protein
VEQRRRAGNPESERERLEPRPNGSARPGRVPLVDASAFSLVLGTEAGQLSGTPRTHGVAICRQREMGTSSRISRTQYDPPAHVHSDRYDWRRLNNLQVGRYAEYFVKMELTLFGFEVYTTDVDDRGIDFVARRPGGEFLEIQVKSLRGHGYVFMQKDKFPLTPARVLALVLFHPLQPPQLYLVPAAAWGQPNDLLVSRDYAPGMKSKPEWGLNLSMKNQPLLEEYRFERMVAMVPAIAGGVPETS